MATYGKRTVILKGHPIVNEDGVATAAIKPGYLVQGVSSVAPHATAGGAAARAIALEKSELGTGIDSTFASSSNLSGTPSPDYAIGDSVQIGVFADGQRFVGYVQSGVSLSEDGFVESAGDGTFRAHTSGVILARALETVAAVALTKVKFEAM